MKRYTLNEVGRKFGTWTIVGIGRSSGNNQKQFLCRCEHGHERLLPWNSVERTTPQTCGRCDSDKWDKTLSARWHGIIDRCTKTRSPSWKNYGGRGIEVCEEWHTYEPFRKWAISNGYRPELDIDRIDNDGNYSPDNCRWVTRSENLNNTRQNRIIDAFGERKTMTQWSKDERCKPSYKLLQCRLSLLGWSAEVAITTPIERRTYRGGK